MSNPVAAIVSTAAHVPTPLERQGCFGSSPTVSAAAPPTATAGAAPALADYQTVLNEFGRMVGDAFKGKFFGVEDKGRLDGMVAAYMARADVTPEQKAAMQKIASEFNASGGMGPGKGGNWIDSAGWADFLSRVGGLIKQLPGGEKIGQALQDFSAQFRAAYDPSDAKFGRDDMQALRGRGGVPGAASELGRLHDLAQSTFRGEQFSAPDFGRFLSGLTLPASAPTPMDPRYRLAAAPSAVPASSIASAAAVGRQPVTANAYGDNSVALNIVNNGTLSLGKLAVLPHAFTDEVRALAG